MTIEEKLILKHMNFKKIWFNAWLEDVDKSDIGYLRLKIYHKFESKFKETISKIKEKKFIHLLNQTSHNDNMWEIPKGRKIDNSEKNLNCAIREFVEETNYDIKKVNVLNNNTIIVKKNVRNILYIFNYYIGFTEYNEVNIKKPIDKIQEISDVKWLALDDIKLLNTNKQIIDTICSLFSILKIEHSIAKTTCMNKIILKKNNTNTNKNYYKENLDNLLKVM